MSLIKVPTNRIENLSAIASRFFRLGREEIEAHNDIDLFDAPGECHDIVAASFDKKFYELEKEFGLSFNEVYDEVARRTSGRFAYYHFYGARS